MGPPNTFFDYFLFDLPGVIIFSLDREYRYAAFTTSHRETMKAIWGVDIEIGKSMLECIHREDDRQKAKQNFDQALDGKVLTLQEEYGDESFQRTWWENRYYPVYEPGHNHKQSIIGVTVFVIDITHLKKVENALRESEINYRSIMDQASDGIFLASPQGKYFDVNRVGCQMLGYTREELLQLTMQQVVVPDAKKDLRIDELLEGKTLIVERELFHKSGHTLEVEISAKMLEDGRLLGIVRDISARRKIEERARFLAFAIDQVSSAVIATDTALKITHWNRGAETLYGWQESEVVGRLVDEVCGTEFQSGQQQAAQEKLLAHKRWSGELKQRHRTGREIWVDASVTLLEGEDGAVMGGVTINRDVTKRKQAEDELRRVKNEIEEINHTLRRAFEREQIASRTDALTGVFNRRYFFELLEYEFAASRRYDYLFSLAMFDVDWLKRINDLHGHQTGDAVLKKAAEVVKAQLRSSDVLARYGGDEFVILLPDSDAKEAMKVLERIQQEFQSALVKAGDIELGISISAGIASIHRDMQQPDQLVTKADKALYAAKNSGRNRIVVSPEDLA
ncbi:MAG: diguanylate cyclase [Chloroflexi bacterium]|nr:diguanylate cyclase [Chloroflexota bacterium]